MLCTRTSPPSEAGDRIQGREARALDLQALGQEVALPWREVREIEGEDDHPPSCDPAQLGQPRLGRLPVVDGDHRHGRVDGVVIERQGLGAGDDRRGRAARTLGTHRRAGLDGENPSAGRLVGAGARPHVEHGPRVAERALDGGGDPRVGAAMTAVGGAVTFVVDPGHPHTLSGPRCVGGAPARAGLGPWQDRRVRQILVMTEKGDARVHLQPADAGRGALVLGHGAGGGVNAPDLTAAAAVALAAGLDVALVEQPYRVAGRRAPAPAPQLDAAWLTVIARLSAR